MTLFDATSFCPEHRVCQRTRLLQASVLLLAAMRLGTATRRLADETGVPVTVVRDIAYRLRQIGLWDTRKTRFEVDLARKPGVVDLLHKAAVGIGLLAVDANGDYIPTLDSGLAQPCSVSWQHLIKHDLIPSVRRMTKAEIRRQTPKRPPRPDTLSLDWEPSSADRFDSGSLHERWAVSGSPAYQDEWSDPTFEMALPELETWLEQRHRLDRTGRQQFPDVRVDETSVPEFYQPVSRGRRWVQRKMPGLP